MCSRFVPDNPPPKKVVDGEGLRTSAGRPTDERRFQRDNIDWLTPRPRLLGCRSSGKSLNLITTQDPLSTTISL